MRKEQVFAYSKKARYCVYFMTKSFRVVNNYSLYEAMNYANERGLKLVIYIVHPYEESDVARFFYKTYLTDLIDVLKSYSDDVKAVDRTQISTLIDNDVQTIFIDQMYLRFDRVFADEIKQLAREFEITFFEVEANVFVPVKVASDKEAYGAYTIRPKILKLLDQYEKEVLIDLTLSKGEMDARKVLETFLINIDKYHLHNDPSLDYTSHLSVYLKYGMISPVTIYHMIKDKKEENQAQFLEELIVRRELAYNYVYYNPTYDRFDRMTVHWAYQTMHHHEDDKRPYIYRIDDYINFRTHDPYFNAAMKQMVYKHEMHGYMRMYWGKKIIEWSPDYESAYKTMIYLNNHYFKDGLTPNGYTGVAWCFGKHDRPWKEREIFGTLRYMNDKGLKRKFNIDRYVKQMDQLEKEFVK